MFPDHTDGAIQVFDFSPSFLMQEWGRCPPIPKKNPAFSFRRKQDCIFRKPILPEGYSWPTVTYSSQRDRINSFTDRILSIRKAFWPANAKPFFNLPFLALPSAIAMQ
jgi:hypothetical protein